MSSSNFGYTEIFIYDKNECICEHEYVKIMESTNCSSLPRFIAICTQDCITNNLKHFMHFYKCIGLMIIFETFYSKTIT